MKVRRGLNNKRIFIVIICALFFITAIFLSAFISIESDHDCVGSDCHTCAELQFYINLRKNIVVTGAILILLIAVKIFADNIFHHKIPDNQTNSLVQLKVKLTI